jgi:tRNA(Ile)-lysidine synthase
MTLDGSVQSHRDPGAGDGDPVADDDLDRLFSDWRRAAGGVLLAVSGGPDSMALLGLAGRWRDRGGQGPLFAATFDHGLRPESAREARLVKDFARALGVPHSILRWTGDKPATRIQERARAARRAALANFARRKGLDLVALAHHRDDQAETLLMRLAAGSGIDGLAGMATLAPLDGTMLLHRPFLALSKARLVATCAARGWPFIADPSNADPRFARPRWRALAPGLAAEGLTPDRLARLARRAGRAGEALEAMVDGWLAAHPPEARGGGLAISFALWAAAPEELRLRLLGRLIDAVAPDDAAPERLERMERLAGEIAAAAPEARMARTLRGAMVARDRSGGLVFSAAPPRRGSGRSS